MRIGLVSQEYPPETAHGGIGTQTHRKAHGLAALGHEVCVISHSLDRARNERSQDGVEVVRIPSGDDLLPINDESVRWLTYSTMVAAELARHEGRFDLVEFPEWGAEAYVPLLNRAGPGPRIVIQLHGPLAMFAEAMGWPHPRSPFFRAGSHMERVCLELADAVYSSSRCSAEWVERAYGLDASAIPVMHSGIDLSVFRPLPGSADRQRRIVFAGKLARNKGIVELCRAALLLAREIPDLRLRIVGRGDDRLLAELQGECAASGLPDLLEPVGFVAAESLPEHMAAAATFAAPSHYEGGPGFVYLEAMACGLPVIACRGSGSSEAVRDGENGLLVDPGDVDGLACALRRVLTDEPLRRNLADTAQRSARETADSERCLDRIEAFYRTVIAGRSRGD